MSAAAARQFQAAFAQRARSVRFRQAARLSLTFATSGVVVGSACAFVGFWTRHDVLRSIAPWAGLLGAGLGIAAARRRAFSDRDVALYLDASLGSGEAITTAREVVVPHGAGDAHGEHGDRHEAVLTLATRALERPDAARARPRLLWGWHAAMPLALAAMVWLMRRPLPPAPQPPAPGTDRVALANVRGLAKMAALSELKARDEAQKKRLEQIAEDARRLQRRLDAGMPQREAQAEVSRLKDLIAAEKLSLGDGSGRAGLEAAVGRLARDPATRGAARALGDRDLAQLDEEMERLAETREQADRSEARKSLEEAEIAARQAGAPDVGKALAQERDRLNQLGHRADVLRELGEALGSGLADEARRELEEFGQDPGHHGGALAQEMARALEQLTPAERARLAEKLKAKLAKGGAAHPGDLSDLAKELGTDEGKRALLDELRRMAKDEGGEGTDESERQRALGDAESGGDEADGELSGRPIPIPLPLSAGAGGKPSSGASKPESQGSRGPKGTPAVEGKGIVARAPGKLGPGASLPGGALGRLPGRAGATAHVGPQGEIGGVGSYDLQGVEGANVPEEYREQVGRYFKP